MPSTHARGWSPIDSSIQDLYQLKDNLVADGRSRMIDYDEWEDAYWGRYNVRRTQSSWAKRWMKFVRGKENEEEKETFPINVIRPKVEQQRAYLAVPPNVRGLAPTIDNDGYAVADYLEKVVRGILSYSNVQLRFGDQGWYLCVQGTAVGVVEWDIEDWLPRINIRSPRNFYAVVKNIDKGTVKDAVFVENMAGLQADAMYPGHGFEEFGTDMVEIVDYWGEKLRGTFAVGGEVTIQGFTEHGLAQEKINPIAIIRNIAIPGSAWGDSIVMGLIGPQNELTERVMIEKEMVKKTMNSPMVINDPINAPREIPEDAGAVITVGQHGGVSYATPPKLDYDWWKSKQELRDMMSEISGTPSILGDYSGPMNSGRTLSEAKGPFMNGIQLRNQYILPAWEQLCVYAIKMMDHFDGVDGKHCILRGKRDSKKKIDTGYTFTYEPDKLQGWTELELTNEAADYLDEQTKFVMLIQAKQNGFVSTPTAMDNCIFVTDREKEMQLVEDEMMRNVRLSMQMQQMQQSPMGAQPDMNEPSLTNYETGKGRQGQAPPPPLPPGVTMKDAQAAMGQQTAMGTPDAANPSTPQNTPPEMVGGGGDLLDMLVQFIGSIPNLKGRVWIALVGSLADGTIDEGDVVEMYFENGLDKQTVFNAVKAGVPDLHQRINPNIGEPPANMQSVECTGGPDVIPGEAGPEPGGAVAPA